MDFPMSDLIKISSIYVEIKPYAEILEVKFKKKAIFQEWNGGLT